MRYAGALAQGLVHDWLMNDNQWRTLRDYRGNAMGVYGAGSGAGAGTSGNIWTFGKTGGRIEPYIAYNDSGTGTINSKDLAVGSSSGSGGPGGNVFTLAFRGMVGAVSGTQAFFGGGAGSSIELRVNSSGNLELLKANVASIGTSTGAVSAGVWFDAMVSYDAGGVVRFYINGLASGSATSAQSFTHAQYYLGSQPNNSEQLTNGSGIAWMRMWNSVLPASAAQQLANLPYSLYAARLQRSFKAPVIVTGIAFDAASNSGTQTAQSTYTFARTITGTGTFLGVDVSILSAGATVTSIIDNYDVAPVNLKFIGLQATVTSLGSVECWGLAGAVTGTKNVQVNLSGSITSAATAASYNGVHQTSPTEAFNSAQATNVGAADATVNITTIADNCWVHGAVVANDDAITANQTTRNNVSFAAVGSGANEDNNAAKTPAGAVTMSYTGVAALKTWAIGGYAIRPTAAASNEPLGAQYLNIGSGFSRFGASVG